MKAKQLYDLRDQTEFCSGADLHEFFHAQTGDPSPSGKIGIDAVAVRDFIQDCLDKMSHNSPKAASTVARLLNERGYIEVNLG